ncbi:MAG: hypothetical protein WC243_02380 [Patescibacteria group bacterium]|jgi:hypothetical protein
MIFRSKKKYIYVLPIMVIAVVGVLYLGFFRKVKPSYTNPFTGNKETVPVKDCDTKNSVGFYTYKEVSEDERKNNKFGIYIYAEQKEFFELAQNLVNSNGGDWGYVLIPYNIRDYDRAKWQGVFESLNNKHLIPIIQLWDVDPDNYKKDTKRAAEFLSGFAWPVKQRYISAYNETNDAKFWRGEVDPAGYAKVLDYTIDTFMDENENFFIMNGAFNVSAPTDNTHMESFTYMYYMNKEVPGIFEQLDGWASHPYPQPNFAGSPSDKGRWSIRAYEDELEYLEDTLDVKKDLPVFITETGWAHAEGQDYNASFLTVSTIADYFELAFEDVWLKDDRVQAVIPFTIWYEPPFDHFSWINKDDVPYLHFEAIKEMDKISGTPESLILQETNTAGCE